MLLTQSSSGKGASAQTLPDTLYKGGPAADLSTSRGWAASSAARSIPPSSRLSLDKCVGITDWAVPAGGL